MSETGKAFETLRRCLKTGDPTGGEEALERIFQRLLTVMGELAQLKRKADEAREDEWRKEFEAGAISAEDALSGALDGRPRSHDPAPTTPRPRDRPP
jgi:hypothetical protein